MGLFDDVKMRVISTAESAVVNNETRFFLNQKGNLVTGEYLGGRIQKGLLVGLVDGNQMKFTYCQLHVDGSMGNGISTCNIERNAAGRLRLVEHFQWSSRPGGGTNIMEEE
jgi:hypothetical protein